MLPRRIRVLPRRLLRDTPAVTSGTLSDRSRDAGTGAPSWTSARLVFIANADNLDEPTSSHCLDELDAVELGRGLRSAERTTTPGGRVLRISVPDGRMSSTHGSLRRSADSWVFEDLGSKNGSFVEGAPADKALLRDGAVLELGRCCFLFRESAITGALPARLRTDVDASQLPARPDGMATFSPSLARDHDAMAQLAANPAVSFVLRGETGTGKELIARALHELSKRSGQFVAVNCGALPAALIETELFGHRRGAYSGAIGERRGLIRSADGGTLLLDEIGELPLASQTALLRVLQEHEVLPVGDDRPVRVDLRIVAATLRDLDAEVAAGQFRADLYARLAGHVVTLPALRERREDLGLVISAILRRTSSSGIRFAPAALRACLQYRWPHNVRELEQALRTAVSRAPGGAVTLDLLPDALALRREQPGAQLPRVSSPTLDPADHALRERLVELLSAHEGNVMGVAETLGKQRAQIYKWVKRLAIDLTAFRRPS